jgi:hypothetical protein
MTVIMTIMDTTGITVISAIINVTSVIMNVKDAMDITVIKAKINTRQLRTSLTVSNRGLERLREKQGHHRHHCQYRLFSEGSNTDPEYVDSSKSTTLLVSSLPFFLM